VFWARGWNHQRTAFGPGLGATTFRSGPEVRPSVAVVQLAAQCLAARTYAFVPRVIPRQALDFLLVLPIRIASFRRPSVVESDSDHSHPNSQEGEDPERESKVGDSWVNLAEA
jgi:hypothetical protein